MFDIESIRTLYNGKAVYNSLHFRARRKERSIKPSDIEHALLSGSIIEETPDDEPLPSVLVLGYTNEGKPLHVAVGVDDDKICFITTYFPTLDLWESDYKTRRSFE